jgi:hypothetical protein
MPQTAFHLRMTMAKVNKKAASEDAAFFLKRNVISL